MDGMSLARMQRWILNHEYFMAYNDAFRRHPEKVAFPPSEEDEVFYQQVIKELLDGIDQSADYELFMQNFYVRPDGLKKQRKCCLGTRMKKTSG